MIQVVSVDTDYSSSDKSFLMSIEQAFAVLEALPDPAFVLTRQGKYVAVFGGRDARYYHDGSDLVGLTIDDIITPEKAGWFLEQIEQALASRQLLITEYELDGYDVKGLPDKGPAQPIWFEARIQALDFRVDGEPVVLWVASNISERRRYELKLKELGETDQLTGLYNRRKMERELTFQFEIFKRHSVPISVLMMDLDNLKHVNDTQGHHLGDEMLLSVADICDSESRKTDTVCRFGGDEFVFVLANTEHDYALQFARRLQRCLRQKLKRFQLDDVAVTASIGVATIAPSDKSHEETLKRADRALYRAKFLGKDRIVPA